MTTRRFSSLIVVTFLSILFSQTAASGGQYLSLGMGGGYAANLYADSFDIGNSYLVNNLSLRLSHNRKLAVEAGYSVSAYEYNTSDFINNVYHTIALDVSGGRRTDRLKWRTNAAAFLRDYTDARSKHDNKRFVAGVFCSYYPYQEWQLAGEYRGTVSRYSSYGDIDNIEHVLDLEIVRTFHSRTTARGRAALATRDFDDGKASYDWIDAELKVTQSLDIRTGLAASFLRRWSSEGTRPLSTYYIVSGVTSYWDPWDGFQAELSIKRILPLTILGTFDLSYWRRDFSYDSFISTTLPWLQGKTGRRDDGGSGQLNLHRQFNLPPGHGRSFAVYMSAGYLSNKSQDPFYEYDNAYVNVGIKLVVF